MALTKTKNNGHIVYLENIVQEKEMLNMDVHVSGRIVATTGREKMRSRTDSR